MGFGQSFRSLADHFGGSCGGLLGASWPFLILFLVCFSGDLGVSFGRLQLLHDLPATTSPGRPKFASLSLMSGRRTLEVLPPRLPSPASPLELNALPNVFLILSSYSILKAIIGMVKRAMCGGLGENGKIASRVRVRSCGRKFRAGFGEIFRASIIDSLGLLVGVQRLGFRV